MQEAVKDDYKLYQIRSAQYRTSQYIEFLKSEIEKITSKFGGKTSSEVFLDDPDDDVLEQK